MTRRIFTVPPFVNRRWVKVYLSGDLCAIFRFERNLDALPYSDQINFKIFYHRSIFSLDLVRPMV